MHNPIYDTPGWRRLRRRTIEAHRRTNGNLCPGYRCAPHEANRLSVDHVQALAMGGVVAGVVQVLCVSCNTRKRNVEMPRGWRRRSPPRDSQVVRGDYSGESTVITGDYSSPESARPQRPASRANGAVDPSEVPVEIVALRGPNSVLPATGVVGVASGKSELGHHQVTSSSLSPAFGQSPSTGSPEAPGRPTTAESASGGGSVRRRTSVSSVRVNE